MQAEILIGATLPVSGPVLRLDEPLSFWGGVDPATGRLTDPRSSAHGRSIAGTVNVSACDLVSDGLLRTEVLATLHRRLGPAALILGATDAIIGLGILVAVEMGWPACPLLFLDAADHRMVRQGGRVTSDEAGRLTPDGTVSG